MVTNNQGNVIAKNGEHNVLVIVSHVGKNTTFIVDSNHSSKTLVNTLKINHKVDNKYLSNLIRNNKANKL